MPQQMAFHTVVRCLHRCQIVIHLLDSPLTCQKHGFITGYKHVVCNAGDPGFDSSLKLLILTLAS